MMRGELMALLAKMPELQHWAPWQRHSKIGRHRPNSGFRCPSDAALRARRSVAERVEALRAVPRSRPVYRWQVGALARHFNLTRERVIRELGL